MQDECTAGEGSSIVSEHASGSRLCKAGRWQLAGRVWSVHVCHPSVLPCQLPRSDPGIGFKVSPSSREEGNTAKTIPTASPVGQLLSRHVGVVLAYKTGVV